MSEPKKFPRYDDSRHVDSAAIDHKSPAEKTYSDEYAKEMER